MSDDNKKVIKAIVEHVVKQTLKEFRSSFRWDQFKSLPNELERVRYGKDTLPLLGMGSSRIVFALPNTKYVLKIATGTKGKAQNQQEVEVFTNPKTKPIVAQIYDFDSKDYSWLVSESVRQLFIKRSSNPESPINSGTDDFYKLTGLNFSIFEKLVWLIDEYKKEWREHIGQEFSRNGQIYQNVVKNYINSPFMETVESLILDLGLSGGDLTKLDSWGKTADGRLVILDYGLSKDVWNTYYVKPNKKEQQEGPKKPAKYNSNLKTPVQDNNV